MFFVFILAKSDAADPDSCQSFRLMESKRISLTIGRYVSPLLMIFSSSTLSFASSRLVVSLPRVKFFVDHYSCVLLFKNQFVLIVYPIPLGVFYLRYRLYQVRIVIRWGLRVGGDIRKPGSHLLVAYAGLSQIGYIDETI